MQTIHFENPLEERCSFNVQLTSTSDCFALDRRQNERFELEPHAKCDIGVVFSPSSIGLADHLATLAIASDKVGLIRYEFVGNGLEPDTQEPVVVTCEVSQTQIVSITFRNTTDSAIYCDLRLQGYSFCLIHFFLTNL